MARRLIAKKARVCLFGCLTSQQHESVSQGRIYSNFTCCYTEIEVADQTFCLTLSQYTDTGTTTPSTDPITPGAWQGSHWSANFQVTGMTRPRKNSGARFNPLYGRFSPCMEESVPVWKIQSLYGRVSRMCGRINPRYGRISPLYGGGGTNGHCYPPPTARRIVHTPCAHR